MLIIAISHSLLSTSLSLILSTNLIIVYLYKIDHFTLYLTLFLILLFYSYFHFLSIIDLCSIYYDSLFLIPFHWVIYINYLILSFNLQIGLFVITFVINNFQILFVFLPFFVNFISILLVFVSSLLLIVPFVLRNILIILSISYSNW